MQRDEEFRISCFMYQGPTIDTNTTNNTNATNAARIDPHPVAHSTDEFVAMFNFIPNVCC